MNQVWSNLASIDCSKNIEKKGNLSYLSWAWAWKTLCDNYPDSTFEFEKNEIGSEFWPAPDGTGEVRCSLTVCGLTRTCWLPVMDYRNKAIENPNARDINDSKMRCLVKAIALFGLGLYIYAGEDIPEGNKKSGDDLLNETKKAQVTAKHETLSSGVQDSFLDEPRGVQVPIGKWEGASFSDLTDRQKEALWEHRKNFEDYPDFMSALQEWRKDA